MTTLERAAAISELMRAADEFAARAHLQEACRDRARPGTGLHHQHAHSATLWRLAEQELRRRIRELEISTGPSRPESTVTPPEALSPTPSGTGRYEQRQGNGSP